MKNDPLNHKDQPKKVRNIEKSMFPTFQDKLFETFKIFWKAGYSYAKTNNQNDFYPKVVESFNEEELDEFLKRYQ
jgi:hypothetical protein